MIFKIQTSENKYLTKLYRNIMQELNNWYNDLNWNKNLPRIFIIEDKNTFHKLCEEQTEDYLNGFSDYSNNIFLYSPKAQEKYTIHKYNHKDYRQFIKHELDHKFFRIYTSGLKKPKWLIEGNAYYVSKQYKKVQNIKNFKTFLNPKKEMKQLSYNESAIAVKLLIERVGKEKYLSFLKNLAQKNFKEEFKNTFNLELNYQAFNKLLHSNNPQP